MKIRTHNFASCCVVLAATAGRWVSAFSPTPTTTTTTTRQLLRWKKKPFCPQKMMVMMMMMSSSPSPSPPPPGNNARWKNIGMETTSSSSSATAAAAANNKILVQQFVDAFNYNNDKFRALLAKDVILDDYNFYFPCTGIKDVERQLRLQAQTGVQIVVDDQVISNNNSNKAGIQFHLERRQLRRRQQVENGDNMIVIPNSRGIVWFDFSWQEGEEEENDDDDNNQNKYKIVKLTRVTEMAQKNGEKTLALLTAASPYMKNTKNWHDNNSSINISHSSSSSTMTASFLNTPSTTSTTSTTTATTTTTSSSFAENNNNNSNFLLTPPVQYFQAWNRRDMKAAVQVFADNVVYEDTAFANVLRGKKQVEEHLLTCAKAFPLTFTFELDDLMIQDYNDDDNDDSSSSSSSTTRMTPRMIMTQWHVEDDGEVLPFTRGISLYKVSSSSDDDGNSSSSSSNSNNNNNNNKIISGLDFIGPAPFKTGSLDLIVDSLKVKFSQEPVRLIPAVLWLAYMYIVFFSDGILPGANALQFEQRTWEEVRDLSLNFFLISPALLQLPFSPTVHPMLEGVFNLLLSWAAMFAGFFSDERRDKPNLMPMVPTVVGMQLLTSAFFLPYLVTRTSEPTNNNNNNNNSKLVQKEDLSGIARVCESRALGPFLAIVGSYSIVWAIVGRYAEFGGLSERWASFLDLLSIDRVGSSFLVDLVIFGLFQGWLIDDDVKRRGGNPSDIIVRAGKYLPFFGLAVYLALRPAFPSQNDP